MKQFAVLICCIAICHGGLLKREAEATPEATAGADAEADPGLLGGYGHGVEHVAVSPIATNTQCHTEYDVVTSQACTTVTEQACNTITETITEYRPEEKCTPVVKQVRDTHCTVHNKQIPEQKCDTITEQACHTVTDTVIDTTTVQDCTDIVTKHCTQTHTAVSHTSAVVDHATVVGHDAIGYGGHHYKGKREADAVADADADADADPAYAHGGYAAHGVPTCQAATERKCTPRQIQTPRVVPRQVCNPVARQVCHTVVRNELEKRCIPTTRAVTETACTTIQVPVPRAIPREVCHAVPRQVCKPVVKKVPRQACATTATQTISHSTTHVKAVGSAVVGHAAVRHGAGLGYGHGWGR